MKISAIAGRNGSGKTLYVDQLRKQLASDKVRYIAFTDSYGVNVDGQYYLQLRWNQHDIDHVKTRQSVVNYSSTSTRSSTWTSFWTNISSRCRVASCASSN